MWKVIDRCSTLVTLACTMVLAVATFYLAIGARESADTARQSAESSSASAAATRDIAELVKAVADSAAQSVETTKRSFELSQRPFLYVKKWRIVDATRARARVQAELHDYVQVPAQVQKVCIWQDAQLSDYARRQYDNVTVREPSVAFGPHHYNVHFPYVAYPQSGQRMRMHLGLVYTFARDGSDSTHTWRADAKQ